jgi:squalene synthase HpnC
MPDARFARDLELYGPTAPPPNRVSLRRARRYCRNLARRHYENFTVVSRLIPPALRQPMYNVYAYCRWADDLADEAGDPARGLALLDWWERQLRECYGGRATHPVFVALGETVRQYAIPIDPFVDLLAAFRQDQRQTRYETFDQLLEYCRYSANPVGRLVLYLAQCHEPRRAIRADCISTGLQLVNFLQDVALDWDRGRVYLPRTLLMHYGYEEPMFAGRQVNEAFRRLMAAEVAEAEGFLRRGLPLVKMMPPEFELDVMLFIHGGLALLEKIRHVDYDVWTRRPVLSRFEKLRLAIRCWWQLRHPPEEVPEEEPEET